MIVPRCRECGCDEDRACLAVVGGGVFDPEVLACSWAVVPDAEGLGVCTACSPEFLLFGDASWVHPPAPGERSASYELLIAMLPPLLIEPSHPLREWVTGRLHAIRGRLRSRLEAEQRYLP